MYATAKDSTATAYGLDITLFGQPADRNVSIGRTNGNTRCSTKRCRETARAYVERAYLCNVNQGRTLRNGDRAPRVLGLDAVRWNACAFHMVSTIDHAYTVKIGEQR